MAHPPLAAQLIVFSKQMDLDRDAARVLDAVRAAGFSAIECGTNTYERDPVAYRAMLDARGLRVAGLHSGTNLDLPATVRMLKAYDTRDLCVSGLGGWNGTVASRYLQDIKALNATARACAEQGYRLHYHNHAYEFAPTDLGPTGMELILEHLDVQAADLCVDVAWVHIAGLEPAAFLKANAARVGYVHLKDCVGERHWVELGMGSVPLGGVVEVVKTLTTVRWVAYEQDTSDRLAGESCAISREYLRRTFGY